MNFNGNSEGDYSGFDMPVDGGTTGGGGGYSTPSLNGGDSSSASDIQNRIKNFGLLGLYGDNGNAMNAFGSLQGGLNLADGSKGTGFQTDDQAWGPSRDPYGNNSQVGSAGWDFTQTPNAPTSTAGWAPGQLGSLGFKGGDLNVGAPTSDAYNGDNQGQGQLVGGNVADFNSWLDSQGYTNKTAYGEGGQTSALFDKNGKAVSGSDRQWQYDPDTAFGLVLAGLSAAAGGAAAGGILGTAEGGVAGAASDAGSLGAEATGATAGSVGSVPSGWAAGAASGAGAGLGGGLASNGPTAGALKSAALGGVTGGFAGGVNLAGDMGVTDPNYSSRLNNALLAGGRAGLTGGNIGQAMLGSGVQSALGGALQFGSGAINNMGDTGTNDDSWDFGQNASTDQPNMSTGPGYNSALSGIFGNGPQGGMSTPSPDTPMGQYVNQSVTNPVAQPYTGDTGAGLNYASGTPGQASPSNPFLKMFAPSTGTNPTGNKPGNYDNMAGNLLQLIQSHRNANQYSGLASGLQSMYAPGSAYAQQLQQQLMRSDAAAGRRSQVGPRSVELQARLADLNSRNAPEIARLMASGQNNQGQELMSLMRMYQGGGGSMIGNAMGGLQNYFQNQNNNGYGGSGNDQYGEGYGPQ